MQACTIWGDLCIGFLARSWRQLSYGVLNQAQRALENTVKVSLQALSRYQFSPEVNSNHSESQALRRFDKEEIIAIDNNEG